MQLTWWLWLWYPLMVWWWWMRGERCLYAHSLGCWKLSAPYLTVLSIGWWDVPSTGLLVGQGREPERGRGLLQWTYSFLWCLLLGRKVMTNLDSILKSRDITLPKKVRLVKAMVFPVVMCGCESLWRKLSTEKLMLLNCGVGEDFWESLGLQGDTTSSS